MLTFTDGDISDVEVDDYWLDKGEMIKGVYFYVYSSDTGSRSMGFFSKEDLQKMIKMIEEVN